MGQKPEFKINPEMERLNQIRETQPDAYQKMPPVQKMSLGLYLQDKEADQAETLNKRIANQEKESEEVLAGR
jgi:hypothetical protein